MQDWRQFNLPPLLVIIVIIIVIIAPSLFVVSSSLSSSLSFLTSLSSTSSSPSSREYQINSGCRLASWVQADHWEEIKADLHKHHRHTLHLHQHQEKRNKEIKKPRNQRIKKLRNQDIKKSRLIHTSAINTLYIFTTKIYRDPTLPLLHRKSAIVGLIILSCLVWGVLYKPSHWTRLDQDVDMTVKVIWTVVYTWAVHVQVAWKGLLNKNKNEGTWSCGSYECCSLGSTHFVVCPHIVSTSLCYISLFLGSWNIA